MTPTWSGWPAVIAAKNADVDGTGPFYPGPWNTDDRDWIPEVYDTGITWNFDSPVVDESVEFVVGPLIMRASQTDLWHPVLPDPDTIWRPVPYPK